MSTLGHSCDLGVGHSCDLPPPKKYNKINANFVSSSYDLRTGKKSTVRARLRAGGKRVLQRWRPPAVRTGCGVFACHQTRGPLWAEGLIFF